MTNQHNHKPWVTDDELRACYESGMTQAEIGVKYGVSQTTVSETMAKLGVARWPRSRRVKPYPPELVDGVRAMYAAGVSQRKIATALSVTAKIVEWVMRRHGIEAHRGRGGSQNAMWKGAAASYRTLHGRVYAVRGAPRLCEDCGTTSASHYDWANLTGKYEDPFDYVRLCRACHWRRDGKKLKATDPRRAAMVRWHGRAV